MTRLLTSPLVAWQQTITGGALNLQAQLVMTDSTLSGSTLALSSADNDQADVALGFGPVVTNTLAAWTDERGGTADVYAKLMGPDGVMGSGFKVHPVTGDQINPQAAYNPDDDEYLVVWQDYRNGAGNPDIYAQRISGAGILAGDNFTITESVNEELAPEVAYGSGVYLVAWRYKVGLEFGDAYAQIISPTGELAGSSFVIMNGNHTQQPTDIIYNPDLGKFFVLWKDSRTAFWDTWGRHVSPNGTMGTAIQITSVNDHHEVNAEGAYNPEEQQYLVVWEDGPAGSNRDILARRILISETVVTTETISIAATGSDEREADVVYLPASGRYAVVWREGSTGDILGRLVTPDGAVDGSAFTISDNANDERMPRIAEDGLGGAIVVWWRDNGSGQKDLYGRQLDPNGQLLESTFTILEQGDVQDKPAVVGAGGGQYLIAWQDDRNGSWDIYASLYQQEHSHSTVITYTYDPLYRLTEAVYAGAITATYEYQYDPVGNMTGYTTTITSTTVVTRTFNDANQLAVSGDGSGNTTYVYDGNGNLVSQIEPEGVDLRTYVYAYDQRNLLVSTHWYRTNYTGPRTDYDYDGSGNRLREWEYAGAQTPPPNPDRIITYTNDILGLSQVLIADDGTEQVVNLFGLDLIHQNGSTEIRTLLADGLGSVRLEMTDDGVETTTTYSPYGDTLTQSGTSGTVYGFTGEQEGSTTGLLYLRARYYNSYLNQFQSRDAFPGQNNLPQSQNGYSYVLGNPVNFVDPTGHKEWASPSSWGEKITGWLHERRNPAIIHIEFHDFPPAASFTGRSPYVDILHSITGDVFEVEPWYKGSVASVVIAQSEAAYYRDLLNYSGGGGRGAMPGLRVLPHHDPNDWNLIYWRLGQMSSFPPIIEPGPRTVSGPAYSSGIPVNIPAGFDFIAVSPVRGAVVWWIQPNSRITAEVFAAAAALKYLKHHIVKQGDPRPAVPGIPVPAPIPAASSSLPDGLLKACGVVLIIGGVLIIVGTLGEDVLTGGLGIVDDPASAAAGAALITGGQELINP